MAGDPEAAALIGDLYARGGELPPNHAEAAMWFRIAAEAGHRMAARALGMLHLTGAGVPRDPTEAARWFRVSAEAGDTQVANTTSPPWCCRARPRGEDSVRTREWFEEAAASGDLVAAFNYGVCLAQGVGVERDDRRAAEWLRRAAEGVVNAQYWYGRMLIEGRGVEPGPGRGPRLDRPRRRGRHDRGAGGAGRNDGERPRRPQGPSKRRWRLFQRAADADHVGAMFAIGALYGGGHDIPWDRPQAQRWFRMAAERGHAHAQLMLGRYLARGLAGETNLGEARVWLERAAAQGMEEAQRDLRRSLRAAPAAPAGAGAGWRGPGAGRRHATPTRGAR